jgi:hypothetical protein
MTLNRIDAKPVFSAFAGICVLWMTATAFIAVTFGYFDEWFFLGLLVVPEILWLIVPIVAIVRAVKRLRQRRFKAAVAWLLVPAIGAVISALGYTFGDAVMFRIHKSAYEAVVKDVSAGRCSRPQRTAWHVQVDYVNCGPPVIIVIPWGGFLSFWHGVIFDASDEISKPSGQRSVAWRATEAGHALQYSGVKRPLGDHYYVAGGSY